MVVYANKARCVEASVSHQERQEGPGCTSKTTAQKTLPEVVAQSTPAKLTALAVGDRVFHPQFGNGTITAMEGSKLSIAFDTHGKKQIIDSYVKRLKK